MIDCRTEYEKQPFHKKLVLWMKCRPKGMAIAFWDTCIWIVHGCKSVVYDLDDEVNGEKLRLTRTETVIHIWTYQKSLAQCKMKQTYTVEQMMEKLK